MFFPIYKARSPGHLAATGAQNTGENLSAQGLAVALLALSSVHDLEHGLAHALEQTLGRLGNAAAFQGRTAVTIDSHD
jgi:hypothetical protein